ncbi:DUF4330 family protein [Halosimplex aquaticum]
MAIIDEDGRIFGTINVVDALAVLLVLAVAAAGIALVTGSDPGEEGTRHVTLDLGSQPEYVLEQLDAGDTASLENEPGNMTITDTYFTPGSPTRKRSPAPRSKGPRPRTRSRTAVSRCGSAAPSGSKPTSTSSTERSRVSETGPTSRRRTGPSSSAVRSRTTLPTTLKPVLERGSRTRPSLRSPTSQCTTPTVPGNGPLPLRRPPGLR